MPVVDVQHDLERLTLTITADFAAPVERVWAIYADPRQLERVWGPPSYPATVLDHELAPGGRVTYSMTGPEGDVHAGFWRITAVDEPHRLEFEDVFADLHFNSTPGMPVSRNVYVFTEHDGGTRAVYLSAFESAEALERAIMSGDVDGTTAAINQIDGLLVA